VLRLDQRYFRTFTLLFVGMFLLLAIGGYFFLRDIEINSYRTMLQNLITQYRLFSLHESTPTVFKYLHTQSSIRVTLIAADGTVIYETNRNAAGMENHFNRPEIILARQQRFGSAIRHSSTLQRDMLYVAHYDGQRFIRMAYPLSTIQETFLLFWVKTLLIVALGFLAAFYLTFRINQSVGEDVRRINAGLEYLLAKQYDDAAPNVTCCQELAAISHQITKVAAKLKKRDRQKSKYTKKLKRLSQQRGEIISAISHEFKNPVAAIIGYTQTVLDDPDITPVLRRKFLTKVITNSERISTMIDRLSLSITLENHALKPHKEFFDLASLVEEVTENLRQKYPDRTIVLSLQVSHLFADRMMFTQVISNLLDNALKYSDQPVEIFLENRNFLIHDHGIGIAPDAINKITRRFYRTDTHSWDNSLGMGLFIVEYILKLHDTRLEISSTIAKGSTFGFALPRHPSKIPPLST